MRTESVCLYSERTKLYFNEKDDGIWLNDIAKGLHRIGFDVTVICDCDDYTVSDDNIRYIPVYKAYNVLKNQSFNYLISDINVKLDFLNFETKLLVPNNIVCCDLECFDLVSCYTAYHNNQVMNYNPYFYEYKISPYVNMDLFSFDENVKKKNKMVCSLSDVESIAFLLEKILPLIREYIYDFEIDVIKTEWMDLTRYEGLDGVNLIHVDDKRGLSDLLKESKVWINPYYGVMHDNARFVDDYYISAIENALCGNVMVSPSTHGMGDIFKTYWGFVGDERFDENGFLLDGDMDALADILSKRVIEVLSDDDLRCSLINGLVNDTKAYTLDNQLNEITNMLKRTYSRSDCCEHMLADITHRLVFHMWIPKIKNKFYYTINNLHLECLSMFKDRFNESVFVLSCEDLNDAYVDTIKEFIYSLKLRGDVHIKIRKNDDVYRESVTFNEEIMFKLDKLDGSTFFAHNKGTSRYGSINDPYIGNWYEYLLKWISFMYYVNLHPIKEVTKMLNSMSTLTYGTMCCVNNNPENSYYRNNWMYIGSFQWINTKRLYDYLGRNKSSYDPSDAEVFIPSHIPYNTSLVKSYELRSFWFNYNEMIRNFFTSHELFERAMMAQVNEVVYDEYLVFHNSLNSVKEKCY